MKSVKNKNRFSQKYKQGWLRYLYIFLAFCAVGLIAWNIFPTQVSADKYADVPSPDDWTSETAVKIYNRNNGQWEIKTYGDVGTDTEFIFGDFVYATTPEGNLFLKPEINIALLEETDRAFNPDDWRMPTPDDIVLLYKSPTNQQKGHWLLKDIKPDSQIVFQGKVWKWELDSANQRYVISDTGNVFARVTAVHKNVHEGDVLALTIKYEACGKTAIVTGTNEHPFFNLDTEQYIPMVDLKPDMALLTDDRSEARVVKLEPLDDSMVMYNLTIEHVHNYFIYPDENSPGVLVHNICDPNKLNHIFGKAEHNLDPFLDAFGGNQEKAFTALESEFSNVAGNYTTQQLNQGIKIIVNDFEITVRGTIVDGIPQIGTAFIPK
jgi:hypothetical protein